MKINNHGLKYLGKNVTIGDNVNFVFPERIEIHDNSRIDDFTILVATNGIKIGKYVHIASFVGITGGGQLIMDDFSGIAIGSKILTGSDDFLGNGMTGPCVPKKFLTPTSGIVHIGKHAVIGANSVVLPNVKIGIGAVVGANSLVTKDLDEWSIYVGSPVRKIKERKKDVILGFEDNIK